MNFRRVYNKRVLKAGRKTLLLTALLLAAGIVEAQVLIEGNVYGGGNLGIVSDNTSVTINDGTIGRKLTFAERFNDANGQVIRVDNGNVYGGGNGYKIDGYRTIPKDDGYGIWQIVVPNINETYGQVKGNTTVTIGGHAVVRRAVYGGGNVATVGNAVIPQGTGIAQYTSGGKTTVTIGGYALIGPKKEDLTKNDAGNDLSQADINNNFKYLGANEGFVFGSSRGISGGALKHLSFADTTIVTITDHAQVVGHVFGGGENGHVQKGTNVIINGDAIIGGVPLHGDSTGIAAGVQMAYPITVGPYSGVTVYLDKEDGELNEDSYGIGRRVFRGNVFGGGKGTDFISWWKEQHNFNKYCYTAGRVYGNTHVTIGGNAKVYNRVYGGGTIASVGTFKYEDSSNANAVTGIESGGLCDVTINGGVIGSTGSEGKNCGEVYGGGRGLPGRPRKGTEGFQTIHQLPDEAYAGRTHVTVNGGTIMNSVYGGPANGHVLGNALVEIIDGTIGTEDMGGWHGNVFAGGGGTAQYTDTKTVGGEPVTFTKHSITAGRVFGDATLSISGGKVYHNVYGGGAIASIGTYLKTPGRPYEAGGHVNVTITGGTIGTHGYENGMVFGSGRGQIDAPDAFMDSLTYVAYSTVNIGTGTVDSETGVATGISGNAKIKGSVYGSGENGHVYLHSQVNVFSGIIGCSAADYTKYKNNTTLYADSLANFNYRGNIYGAGCGTDQYTAVIGENTSTHQPITEQRYNPNAGYVQGNTEVNIYGGYISRNVYGGGAMASVGFMDHTQTVKHDQTTTQTALSWPYKLVFVQIPNENSTLVSTGKASVNIRGGHIGTVAVPINSGNVFGAARGDVVGPLYMYDTLALARETEIYINFTASGTTITDATANCITSSVYGSGENGQTYDNTKVTLANGLIGGSVFGGGRGTDTYAVALKNPDYNPDQPTSQTNQEYLPESQECSITAGKVYGNTEVNISGGTVLHNVYGGGNLASVGKGNYYGYGEMTGETTGPETPYENSGTCTVNITGGTIGTNGLPDSNGNLNGFVYGSSKGTTFKDIRKNPRYDYSRDFFVGYSNSTVVTIGDPDVATTPTIKGSVFGGGENGHVRWHTNVTVNKGEIGAAYVVPGSYPESPQDTINKWVYRGNVFGAGRGIDKIGDTEDFCSSAGSVTLNTTVTVNGGTIHRNVYGGGSNASIGAPPTGFEPGGSKCTVNIKGGIIGEIVTPTAPAKPYLYGGDVYGGSRGSRELIGTDNIGSFATVTETDVNIDSLRQGANTIVSSANVIGNVYGGGEVGQVKTNTNVDIAYGTVQGSVYGGGKGEVTDEKAALVAGNATVNMTNGTVERSIYGGGELGNVGTYIDPENPTSTDPNLPYYTATEIVGTAHVLGEPKACKTGTGLATVKVSGGMVGKNGSLMPGPNSNPDDDDRGWIFCGGRGSSADTIAGHLGCNPKANLFGIVGSTYLEISETNTTQPVITASVYGGCENGLTLGNTHVKIMGGQIGTGHYMDGNVHKWDNAYSEDKWNAAISAISGGNATAINAAAAQFHECDAFPYGIDHDNNASTPKVYYVYDIYADPTEYPSYDSHGGSLQGSNGHSFFGNVFGGGSGYYPIAPGIWRRSAGRVWGDTHVEILGGHILTSVYGGNETTDVMGKCTVEMSGGTLGVPRTLTQIENHPVTCYLFGAGMGDPRTMFNTWTNVKEVVVNITGGTFFGSIFGGGEEGHVLGDVAVNVGQAENKTTLIGTWGRSYVDGNVFGGGRGFSGNALTAGVVTGNVNMTISGGTMLGSIYGGGRLASVGTNLVDPNSPQYGQLIPDNGNDRHGHVTINITGGTIGNDYEAIYHTNIDEHTTGGNVFAGAMGRLTNLDNSTNTLWPNLGKVKETVLTISGDNTLIKGNVYGGGEFGTVETDATITVSGGTIMRDVYGGGYGSTDITSIGQLRVPNGSSVTLVDMTPMKLAGRVNGNTKINVEGGWIQKSVYGGGEMATVGVINDSVAHTSETTEFALSWPYKMNYEANTGKTEINVTGGRIGITGSDYMGPYAMINGQLTPVKYNDQGTAIPLTDPEIDEAEKDNGDVYGGGKGIAAQRYLEAHATNVHDTHITINYSNNSATPTNYKDKVNGVYSHDCIAGAVYGGGENGHVIQHTNITLTDGLVGHNIYGGGKGKGTFTTDLWKIGTPNTNPPDSLNVTVYSITSGKVYGNTHVTMEGGYVVRNIFGGGNMASVGKGNYTGAPDDYSTTGYGECVTTTSAMADTLNSGNTFVTITGGQLGYLNPGNPNKVIKDGLPYGSVYGGCRGMVSRDVPRTLSPRIYYCPEDFLGYVNNTHVVIGSATGSGTGPRLYGSVYGGGQDGHVRWNTNITFNKGEIGVDFGGTELIANDETIQNDPNSHHWANRGNVYGAGSGIGQYTDANNVKHYSYISGSVTQFTNVEIKGGIIHNNVYGGGNLATVGPPRILQSVDCPADKTGVTVNIKGNAEIGKNTNLNAQYGGKVFGASRGIACDTLKDGKPKYKDFAYCSYTEVNVSESPIIYDAVFGGGENGKVGLYHENRTSHIEDGQNIHTSTVNISGGTIINAVYGAGQGVFGDVIPGSSPVAYYVNDTMSGRVMGNATVNLMGGTVGHIGSDGIPAGLVFGGARRSMVWGNTTVNVGSMTRDVSYGGNVTIKGSVYGANNYKGTPLGNATVNVYQTHHDATPDDNYYPTIPETIPNNDTLAWLNSLPSGINNFAIYRVFGGGNQTDYTPRSGKEATVHVYQCDQNTIYEVYGGGNAASIGKADAGYTTDANVIIDGGRIYRVYGGGNGNPTEANIYGTADTDIYAGLINEVFGGSNNLGFINAVDLYIEESNHTCAQAIGNIYGGGNVAPFVGEIVTTLDCGEGVYGSYYGGARQATIYGNVTMNVKGGTYERVFGGSQGTELVPADIKRFPATMDAINDLPEHHQAAVRTYLQAHPDSLGHGGNVTLNLMGGEIHVAAYGGSDVNGNIEGKITVNVVDIGDCDLDLMSLYGAGRTTDYEPNYTVAEGQERISPVVNLIHGTVKGSVFGGGYGDDATTYANPEVNIGYDATTMSALVTQMKQAGLVPTSFNPGNAVANVNGNVYGGGEEGPVDGSTTVNLYKGTIGTIAYTQSTQGGPYDGINLTGGNVFGGGKGSTNHVDYGLVMKNATVNIKGGHVLYNVYGGGELASVGEHTPVYQTPGDDTTPLVDFAPVANTGLATVNITGGQVGPAPRRETVTVGEDEVVYNIPCGLNGLDGYVYGGGKGEGDDQIDSDNPYGKFYAFANVNNTLVTIDIPMPSEGHPEDSINNRIWGSVFGGAEDGHVLGDTRVNYKRGYLGTDGTTSYDGNIFGGGRNYDHKNYTAGRVGGNTTVVMSGGQLFGNIYGGGRLGITGMSLIGMIPATDHESETDYYQAVQEGAAHGNAKVIVMGGTIGNNTVTSTGQVIETFSKHSMGSVYGGGMGTMEGINIPGHPKASSLLFGMTKNTEVIVKDSINETDGLVSRPHIYGVVFGGGEIANVGKFTWKQVGIQISKVDVAGEGTAKVSINGGIIGGDRTRMRDDHSGPWLTYNDDLGYVYGGGEGLSDDPQKKVNGVRVYPDVNTTQFGDLTLLDLMSTVYKTEVEISGGWVKASVFGGSESGHVMNDTKVTISGGQIGAGYSVNEHGAVVDLQYSDGQFINPVTTAVTDENSLSGTAHWPYGKTTVGGQTVYTPFDPVYLNNNDTPSDGRSWFGNVFGGGSGWFPYVLNLGDEDHPIYESHWNPNSGKVWGNTEVIITGGHILNNVYGANETTDVGGKATVRMSGGTVGVPRTETQIQKQPTTSYVFGGGAGDPRCNLNVTTNVDTTDVQITGGIVYGAVFGGGEMGHVVRGTSVSIDQAAGKTTVIGSTGFSGYDGHVYGGGKGDETDYDPVPAVLATETEPEVPSHPNFAPGRVGGNTKVTMSKGTVLGNLYGGGMIARTGVGVEGDFNAFVTGEGASREYDSIHHGTNMVEVSGGIIGVGGTKARALAMLTNEQKTGNVYGGGRGKVDEYIEDDYGRSANAVVYIHNTNTDTIYGSVYGGGQMANVGHWNDYADRYTTHTGATSVTITGNSTLGTKLEFDHDNYAATSPTSTLYESTVYEIINNVKRLNHTRTGNVYGGGQGDVRVITVNGKKHAVGLEQGHCRTTKVNISGTPTIRSCVFGGSNEGTVWGDTKVTIEGGTIGTTNIKADSLNVATDEWVLAKNKYSFGSVFGGSYGLDSYTHLSCSTHVVVDSVNSLAGRVYGNTEITISGGTVCENVYGGGNLASVGEWTVMHSTPTATDTIGLAPVAGTGHSKVTISGTAEIGPMDKSSMNAYVFGGGKGITYDSENRYKTYCNSNSTEVIVALDEEGRICGSVFGGAGDAHVLDSTSVTINSGTIGTTGYGLGDGCVYGGGGNLAQSNYVAGRVGGNANVTIKDGWVMGNVYGGGYAGLSGVDMNGNAYNSNLDDHGNVTINMEGGTVGILEYIHKNNTANNQPLDSIDHHNTGMVFGGGKGDMRTPNPSQYTIDPKFGLVTGSTNVTIAGGHVYNNVYGGGEMGSVGLSESYTYTFGEQQYTDYKPLVINDTVTGYAKVKVTGGQVGPAPKVETGYNLPIGLNGLDGYVFGGGKGVGDDPITPQHPIEDYKHFANVNYACTEVDIPANADTTTNRIWGSLFGGAEDGHVLGSDTVKLVSGLVGTYGTTSYDGNIFGGGRNFHKKNYTAGRTRGNITVDMSGGQLRGSLFGGGRLAITGLDVNGHIIPDEPGDEGEKFGAVKVKVSGGEVGNKKLMETFTKYSMGEVFGGGKGDMTGIDGHPAASALLISLVHNTEVEITGDARIYGSVYGGGEVANVGEFRWNQNPTTHDITNIRLTGGGHSKVTVSGGTIGADRMRMDYTLVGGSGTDKYNLKYNTDVGHVCGGGKGIVDNPNRLVPGTTDSYYGTANVIYGTASAQDVSLLDVMATVNTTEVIIKEDAYVKGSVFGGAMNGHVLDSTYVKMEGGQIGAGKGAEEDIHYTDESVFVDPAEATVTASLAPTYHWVYGKLYDGETVKRYDPFDPILVSQDTLPSDGRTWFGNLYGGGSGYYPYIVRNHNDTADSTVWNRNAGIVRGNTRVKMTGGHVLSCVYGGCETTDVLGHATVILEGGSSKPTVGVPRVAADIKACPIPSYVYGSGNGDPRTNFNTWTNVDSTYVKINNSIVYGSVFGGGMDGHVLRNTHVEVLGGTIGTFGTTGAEGNVFGGGRGSNPVALTAGGVGGNTRVDIKDGRMLGSIFGGGNNGSVGIQFTAPDASNYGEILDDNPSTNEYHGYTTVNISGGSIGHDDATGRTGGNVYGGCRGMAGAPGSIYQRMAKVKTTHVNISEASGKPTFIRGSVFGGGEDGHVLKDTYVTVSGGQIGGEAYVTSGEPEPCQDPYHGNVYGGGRGLDTYTDASGEHYSITAGKVDHNTHVVIKGGCVTRNVYGGGNIASVGEYRTDESGNLVVVNGEYVPETGTGLAQVTIKGGKIGVYNDDDLTHGNVFGSSHGLAGALYKDLAYVHNTEVRLDSVAVVYGAVFGGGEDGHVNQHTLVSVNGNAVVGHEDDVDSKGNVYGGGRGVDLDETQTPPVLSPTAGLVKGHTRVYINSGHLYGSVYGGGHTSKVLEERVVNINGGIVEGNVFGGGNTSASEDTYYTSMKTVNVRGGQIHGNVFGGSYSANEGDPTLTPSSGNPNWTSFVNITGGTIGTTGGNNGNVYAAGYAGQVKGSVCINIGANAINNAPNKSANEFRSDAEGDTPITPSVPTNEDLVIKGSVYGGSNQIGTEQTTDLWNTFDITGYSKIYIDGTDYDTRTKVTPYMDLQGGLYGCGTHCESGAMGRDVFLRKYGARNTDAKSGEMTSATRTLQTAQRIGNFVIDESNVNFVGYRDISGKSDSLYAVVKINQNFIVADASSMVLGSPASPAHIDSIQNIHSYYLLSDNIYQSDNVAGLSWGWIGIQGGSLEHPEDAKMYHINSTPQGEALTFAQENVILFNGRSRMWVRYHNWEPETSGSETYVSRQYYGELKGFFRMRADNYQPYGYESFAEARRKLTSLNDNGGLDPDNEGDGGFLSYNTSYNFHTKKDDRYPQEGNDGGLAYTNTKQYPYSNRLDIISAPTPDPSGGEKVDLVEYRLWAIPKSDGGRPWYVDGRSGGIGVNGKTVGTHNGRGLYPDLPKKTISGSTDSEAADALKGIYSGAITLDGNTSVSFDQKKDVIYVVGAVSSTEELAVNASGILNTKLASEKPLRLYRYPGGHPTSTGSSDDDPGANYHAMIEVDDDKAAALTLNKVVVDGMFGYEGFDPFFITIPESFVQKNVDRPLVIAYGGSTLTLCDSTTLKNGYNRTNADLWYTNADYEPYDALGALTDYHGGGLFVDKTAVVNVKDSVYITGNKQYSLLKGEDHPVNCNVYLPTFNDSYLNITGELFKKTRIGVTSPKRNKAVSYVANTFSPVAKGVRPGTTMISTTDGEMEVSYAVLDAKAAWVNCNFLDDQGWFFVNENKTIATPSPRTTYYNGSGTKNRDNTMLYFGWTWASVVRTAPTGYSNDNIDSPEDLAWLITSVPDATIKQTADLDMGQYVWVPIGDGDDPFVGKFDGQGHLIKNLYIDYIGTGDKIYERANYGLFGNVHSGTVNRTFVVSGVYEPYVSNLNGTQGKNIGGLVGYMEGASIVSNSEAAVTIMDYNIDATVTGNIMGGLVAKMMAGEVHSSMAMSTLSVVKSNFDGIFGGLVGDTRGGAINNSFANATFSISNNNDNVVVAGGLVGVNTTASIKNCYVNWQSTSANTLKQSNFGSLAASNTTAASNIQNCYVKENTTYGYVIPDHGSVDESCKQYSPVNSADILGYMYTDNTVPVGENANKAMFSELNKWVDNANNSAPRKYAKWARPGLAYYEIVGEERVLQTPINGDLPVLLISNYDASGKIGAGDFRTMGTYAGGPVLQYGGPIRDEHEIDEALERPKASSEVNDYLFVYGDITEKILPSAKAITQSKVSIHEDAAIMDAGTLADYENTYVGVTFDNSFGHATSTPGINYGLNGLGMGGYLLPRDWHMFSSPLQSAPLGFDYKEDNDPVNTDVSGHVNNPWWSWDDEFHWLQGGSARYWMYGWENSLSQSVDGTTVNLSTWEDGYFPSESTTFGAGVISGSDEDGYFPYGMDLYTWTEPDYHWINFKRNGPNHWHSDNDHEHIDYKPYGVEDSDPYPMNVNEDNLIVGRGYMASIATETFMQSHGKLNANDTEEILLTSTSSSKLQGWNLVGNPFHSYLDFNKVGASDGPNNDVLNVHGEEGAFYVVYNADKYGQEGGYGTDAASTAFRYYPVNGSIGGDYAERYLHPHQGFYVSAAKEGSLKFNKKMLVDRSTAGDANHLRDEMPAYPLVNLYLSSDQGCADVTVIEFERPEWGGARKIKELRVGDGLFYAHHGDTKYAALFAQTGIDRVPLWFEAKEDDIFTMKWNLANADFHSMYLIDNIAGVQYDMLRNNTYCFEGHKSDYPSRFLIVFSLTDVDEHLEGDGFVFFDGSQWMVTGEGDLEFIDVQGQVLMRKHVSGGQSRVGVPDVAPGVYLFRLTNSSDTRVQKVIVKR